MKPRSPGRQLGRSIRQDCHAIAAAGGRVVRVELDPIDFDLVRVAYRRPSTSRVLVTHIYGRPVVVVAAAAP